MDVYAADIKDNDYVWVISMEECEKSPWRWKFIGITPGQDLPVEVTGNKESNIDIVMGDTISSSVTKKKGTKE